MEMRTTSWRQNSLEIINHPQQQQTQNKHQNQIFLHPKHIPNQSKNWSYHIRNCITQGSPNEALLVYKRIRRNGNYLLGVVPLVLKACASLAILRNGKALHSESIKVGIELDVIVGTSLVDMYAKCGEILESRKMFDYMPQRNVVTCNAMIGGYMRNGDTKSASVLFEWMRIRTAVSWIEMIDGFAKNGDMVIAKKLFDRVPHDLRTVVTWMVLIEGYARIGEMDAAREVFETMPKRNFYVWSSMVSGYFRKGEIEEARAIFDRISFRNLVIWNSLISGYAQNGFSEEALDAFRKMQDEGFEPDEITLASVLSACAQLGLLDVGKEIHRMIVGKQMKLNQFVLNGLVDMYAKCGDLSNARLVFERISSKNDACWNAMISGFAFHGQCKEALEFFQRMENSSEKPNAITFVTVLSACAHGGFVKEGIETFSKMEKYDLKPTIKHYGCLIDLLARAGKLKEAYNLIKKAPVKPNDTVWGALLGSCRIHADTETTTRVLNEVEKTEFGTSCNTDLHYVTLSNIYAASDRWEKSEEMRMVVLNKRFQKKPGKSSIMLSGAKHMRSNGTFT